MHDCLAQIILPVRDYDLAATLASGQAFRWTRREATWEGVIGGRWVRLSPRPEGIAAETLAAGDPEANATRLRHYLQTDTDLAAVLATFPDDEPMRAAVRACRGLRLLRQEPWECLASFLLSATKQIVQIQQIVGELCLRFGEPVPVPPGHAPAFAFPTAKRLAGLREADLRACKMGFRAPYLLASAQLVRAGEVNLARLQQLSVTEARAELLRCPGVGDKIANCVLLFAYGFQPAFPVDVWVRKALRTLYFPRRAPREKRLLRFIDTHFGPNAGYAQQYLFHYMRLQGRGKKASG